MSGGWVGTSGLRFVLRKDGLGQERRILQQRHVEQRDPQTAWVNPPETKWIDVPLVEDET